ncbi:MAG: class I SAM-dependent methyltransferase family protein [Candidatus Aenigmarchaeota archaeon]|nr:class I SAM-dependent methyltransferase family protein [Candidatus Aenigmarchaeota archaeon]
MAFRELLSQKTGITKEKLPGSYQILGRVFIAKMPRMAEEEKKKAAQAVLEMFPRVKTVCEIRGVRGELREPDVRKIAGNGTETVVMEHGIKYKLDTSKIMFSKGNHHERQRVAKLVLPNDVVMDMFAGIGYFTLGIARNASKVIAIEKNPIAFAYLKENVKLNGLANVETLNSDSRNVEINEKADRIIMGYFPGTEAFIPFAIRMLKDKGTIHYHNVCDEGELEKKDDFASFAERTGFSYKILLKKKVKGAAPKKIHYVMDVAVEKK